MTNEIIISQINPKKYHNQRIYVSDDINQFDFLQIGNKENRISITLEQHKQDWTWSFVQSRISFHKLRFKDDSTAASAT